MGGRVVVEQSGHKVVLRKRHYPLLCAIWCYGIMGGVVALGAHFGKSSRHPLPLPFVAIVAFIPASLFVAIAIHLDRKPALLVFDSEMRKLIAPRQEIETDASIGLRLGFREVKFESGDGWTVGGALYVARGDESEDVPIFFEHALGHFRKRVKRFASLTSIPMLELPRITVE